MEKLIRKYLKESIGKEVYIEFDNGFTGMFFISDNGLTDNRRTWKWEDLLKVSKTVKKIGNIIIL